jgi:rhodanese-related sulfurtransferase
MQRETYQSMVAELSGKVEEIFPWELIEELKTDPELLLLDIRCPHEYEAANISNSINVPRGILEIAVDFGYEETMPQLVNSRQKRVVVICRSGNRSMLASHTLKRMGYENVASLRTGIRGWNDYEQPLFTGEGERLELEVADKILENRIRPDQLASRHIS